MELRSEEKAFDDIELIRFPQPIKVDREQRLHCITHEWISFVSTENENVLVNPSDSEIVPLIWLNDISGRFTASSIIALSIAFITFPSKSNVLSCSNDPKEFLRNVFKRLFQKPMSGNESASRTLKLLRYNCKACKFGSPENVPLGISLIALSFKDSTPN
ncbi:hypothetical protein Bhyg_15757 [Pseudolycoriella hygida]|uniref:Uncharacterized protein n=1 Tax=Pseudolycoriella hygida TaxID=35572 RepID=A0A9Q0RUU2_9DIPT|nr:hypothetical protein Bhyg_15757 [Pseudolycoriella hygida]